MGQVRGAFPFPIAQVQEGTSSIVLYGGNLWYPPAGEYIVNTPSNGVVEWFEPQSQTWRQLVAAAQGDYFNCDGYNIRLHNLTGTVTATTISNAGSGMTNGIGSTPTAVSMAVAASNTTGYQTATLQPIIGGSVAAPTITQAGSGFLSTPMIVIDPPPAGGIQATAYAVLTAGGGIASVTMSAVGAGYAASPNFYVIPVPALYQGGPTGSLAAGGIPAPGLVFPTNAVPGNQNTSPTGAQLTPVALTGSGTLTGIIVGNPGSGYTSSSPSVTFTGGAGGVAATVTIGTTTLAAATFYLTPRVQ